MYYRCILCVDGVLRRRSTLPFFLNIYDSCLIVCLFEGPDVSENRHRLLSLESRLCNAVRPYIMLVQYYKGGTKQDVFTTEIVLHCVVKQKRKPDDKVGSDPNLPFRAVLI